MILFVFRDPARRGTSVEEIYNGIKNELDSRLNIQVYYYQDKKSMFWNIWSIRKFNPQIVHITSDMYFIVPFLLGKKIIITIHDIGRYKELTGMKKLIYKCLWLSLPAKLADIIITVSDYTSRDILDHISRNLEKKIIRIYNPLPEIFVPAEKEFNNARPVLLQVGTIPNKNVENVIRALSDIPCHLILIGRLSDEQQKLLKKHKIQYSNFFGLDYKEVYEQYAGSDIVLFISSFEGFGMPVIEANAAGKPVVCSAVSSLPEIGGKGAVYVQDPKSVDEINTVIKKLIGDTVLRNQIIKEGYDNIKRFEMNTIVAQYEKVYDSLLASV